MELKCAVQNYAWGVKGTDSSVAVLANAGSNLDIIRDVPYAELWMGTHPNAPSIIKDTNEQLGSYIKSHPESLGKYVLERFGPELPFLLKVLSVDKALSIQAHPTKAHAEVLHKDLPHIYKDPNHKPEMAIALTPFQALCGFRPAQEIAYFLKEIPELRPVISETNCTAFERNPSESNLKMCFSALMNANASVLDEALRAMQQRFDNLDATSSTKLLYSTFNAIHSNFPNDRGCIALYLLNNITLSPGEAIYLGPNVIHAYLKGDCVECMACSDNVVRAGLTPKLKDVPTLVSMLEYDMLEADLWKFKGQLMKPGITLYNPPVPDFAVEIIQGIMESIDLCVLESASVLLVVEGKGVLIVNGGDDVIRKDFSKGKVFFLKAGQKAIIQLNRESSVLAFRSYCSL